MCLRERTWLSLPAPLRRRPSFLTSHGPGLCALLGPLVSGRNPRRPWFLLQELSKSLLADVIATGGPKVAGPWCARVIATGGPKVAGPWCARVMPAPHWVEAAEC